MRARVLFLSPPEYHNPPWAVCRDVIHNLDRERVEPFVVVDRAAEDPGVPADVPVERFALTSGLRRVRKAELPALGELAAAVPGLVRYVRSNRVDIIHVNDNLPSVMLGTPLARATGARLVVHYHSAVASTAPTRFEPVRLKALSLVARLAAANVACSRHVARQVERLLGPPPERLVTVLNGVDVDRFHPGVDRRLRAEYGFGPDEVVVLQLARIQQQKRPEDLVRAVALARARAPTLRALIVGWTDPRYSGAFPSYLEELQDLAKRLGVADRVVFGAARPEAPELHAASDVGVLCSSQEAFGLVVAESQATGRPFVGADGSGISEGVAQGESGWVYPLGDAAALADRLVELALEPDRRQRMGDRAREWAVRQLSSRRMGKEFSDLYDALAKGTPLPTSLRAAA